MYFCVNDLIFNYSPYVYRTEQYITLQCVAHKVKNGIFYSKGFACDCENMFLLFSIFISITYTLLEIQAPTGKFHAVYTS